MTINKENLRRMLDDPAQRPGVGNIAVIVSKHDIAGLDTSVLSRTSVYHIGNQRTLLGR